jgi:hypothetical protein
MTDHNIKYHTILRRMNGDVYERIRKSVITPVHNTTINSMTTKTDDDIHSRLYLRLRTVTTLQRRLILAKNYEEVPPKY